MFPAEIGYVKRKDTSYLNQLFNEEKIKAKFPANIKFAYGNYGDNPLLSDSILRIYALRIVEKSSNLSPKGNQITDVSVEADKLKSVNICATVSAVAMPESIIVIG